MPVSNILTLSDIQLKKLLDLHKYKFGVIMIDKLIYDDEKELSQLKFNETLESLLIHLGKLFLYPVNDNISDVTQNLFNEYLPLINKHSSLELIIRFDIIVGKKMYESQCVSKNGRVEITHEEVTWNHYQELLRRTYNHINLGDKLFFNYEEIGDDINDILRKCEEREMLEIEKDIERRKTPYKNTLCLYNIPCKKLQTINKYPFDSIAVSPVYDNSNELSTLNFNDNLRYLRIHLPGIHTCTNDEKLSDVVETLSKKYLPLIKIPTKLKRFTLNFNILQNNQEYVCECCSEDCKPMRKRYGAVSGDYDPTKQCDRKEEICIRETYFEQIGDDIDKILQQCLELEESEWDY